MIAAKVTKTGTIGFVGGKDIPIIHRFFVGDYYGAKMASPDVNVLDDTPAPSLIRRRARSTRFALVNQKSDIKFAVAGATSSGVIDAAKEKKTFAIGVNSTRTIWRRTRPDLDGKACRYASLRHDQIGRRQHVQGRDCYQLRPQGRRR